MKVRVSSVLAMPKQEVWELMQQAPTLIYLYKSWVEFVTENGSLQIYEGQLIHAFISPVRRLRSASYWIAVDTVDPDRCLICTRESGVGVKRLQRSIQVHHIDTEACGLTIEMNLHAGLLTPFIAAWIWFYYQFRCLRRRSIIKRSVRYKREI